MKWIKSEKLWVSVYVLAFLFSLTFLLGCLYLGDIGERLPPAAKSLGASVLVAGVAGTLYLIRAIYLNACVYQRWSSVWLPWYFLRPFTSMITGSLAWIALNAGIIALDAQHEPSLSNVGFLLIAFIAGYNVDNFLKLIEQKGKAALGVKESRASSGSSGEVKREKSE